MANPNPGGADPARTPEVIDDRSELGIAGDCRDVGVYTVLASSHGNAAS